MKKIIRWKNYLYTDEGTTVPYTIPSSQTDYSTLILYGATEDTTVLNAVRPTQKKKEKKKLKQSIDRLGARQ